MIFLPCLSFPPARYRELKRGGDERLNGNSSNAGRNYIAPLGKGTLTNFVRVVFFLSWTFLCSITVIMVIAVVLVVGLVSKALVQVDFVDDTAQNLTV